MSKPKGIRLAIVIGDTHAGSSVGLLPPDFSTLEGQPIGQNAVQKWLWECWTDWTENWLPALAGNDPFVLILNGDLIEGKHHGTTQVISDDTKDHASAAFQILAPIAKRAAKVYVTLGTECHTKTTEHSLGKELGATPEPGTKRYAWDRLDASIGGTRTIVTHHITPTSRPWLEASALSIHLGAERLEAVRNGEPHLPKVLCCQHRHRFGTYSDGSGLCVVGPAWQMGTRHTGKVVPNARCQPGVFALDMRGRKDGELPDVPYRTYQMPSRGMVML